MHLYEEGYTQNREISWLRYNDRVLDEAMDESVPLFERLNYIHIFMNNLEEFFKVRVGSLLDDVVSGDNSIDSRSGLDSRKQLNFIYRITYSLIDKKDLAFQVVDLELRNMGIQRVIPQELLKNERTILSSYYRKNIRKKLKARIADKVNGFPLVDENKSYILCRLSSETGSEYGVIDIPRTLPKIYVLEPAVRKDSKMKYILTEDIIKMFCRDLFEPFELIEYASFDIARNADVELGEGSDPLEEMKKAVKKRRTAPADKLVIDNFASKEMISYIASVYKLNYWQIFKTSIISLDYISELKKAIPYWLLDEVTYKPYKPFNQLQLSYGSVIDNVLRHEILSSYPYDSMDPFLQLIKESVSDTRVKEINMTIYRLSSNPDIIKYLAKAAQNGKLVKVLIEVRARFDEEKNIDWAELLKESGVKVHFGSDKYKVHSKVCQIVLEENGVINYISQLGTGNYNEKTVLTYTDLSLITADKRIGLDVRAFFDDIFHEKTGKYTYLLASPTTMKDDLIFLIRQEAMKGRQGRIFIKCNSISDEKIIEELVEASCKGCKIRLIVRGICCILPGIKSCTENIEIVNVVGRYLEHSRVYMFGYGKDEKIYISSADLMTRNMKKRIEIACPIFGKENREIIKHIIGLNFADNVKGRVINRDGSYSKKLELREPIDSQAILMKENTY